MKNIFIIIILALTFSLQAQNIEELQKEITEMIVVIDDTVLMYHDTYIPKKEISLFKERVKTVADCMRYLEDFDEAYWFEKRYLEILDNIIKKQTY